MTDTNGHNALTALLYELTGAELLRLERALNTVGAEGTDQVDLRALVDEIRTAPPRASLTESSSNGPTVGSDAWKREVDRGRGYELLLMMPPDEAAAQHTLEWREVDVMVAGGLTHKQAWARIRERYGNADSGFIPNGASRDAQGANGDALPGSNLDRADEAIE